jgi:hypothetical protein
LRRRVLKSSAEREQLLHSSSPKEEDKKKVSRKTPFSAFGKKFTAGTKNIKPSERSSCFGF